MTTSKFANYLQLCLICLFTTIFSTSCEDEVIEPAPLNKPISVEQFMINLTETAPEGSTLTVDKNEPFRIDFTLTDDTPMWNYQFFLFVNNDDQKRYILTENVELQTTEITLGYTFSDLNQFTLANGTVYQTQAGDELYFYANVLDGSDVASYIEFVVTLEE